MIPRIRSTLLALLTGCFATSDGTAAPKSKYHSSIARVNRPAGRIPLPSSHEFFGQHFMASYIGCDSAALRDLSGLREAFRRAADASGATVLAAAEHVFDSNGLTLILLLSESHASIHTYPECEACFVDLFTCGRGCLAERFDEVLRFYLRPATIDCQTIERDRGIRPEYVAQSLPRSLDTASPALRAHGSPTHA